MHTGINSPRNMNIIGSFRRSTIIPSINITMSLSIRKSISIEKAMIVFFNIQTKAKINTDMNTNMS